jgi:hypothetical protein
VNICALLSRKLGNHKNGIVIAIEIAVRSANASAASGDPLLASAKCRVHGPRRKNCDRELACAHVPVPDFIFAPVK